MKQNYEIYRDFVFINRRLTTTRFKRNIIFFSGVNSEGKVSFIINNQYVLQTIIFGVSLIKEDNYECLNFAFQSFLNSVGVNTPHTIIIERQSTFKNVIESCIKEKNIILLYCYQHLHKSLKFQIRNLMHGKPLSEKTKSLMLRVEKLPKIDSFGKL